MMSGTTQYIYIIVSRTDTVLGRMIRKSLGVPFNHCSIATDQSLSCFYSIGRKGIYNPLRAGFVEESKDAGFFKIHSNAQIAVLRVAVTEEQLHALEESLAEFQAKAAQINYSLLGLVYCYFGISTKRENKYFCSQFVAELLQSAGIELLHKPPTLTRPHDFLQLPEAESIYTGTFQNYCFG